jgi:hypothetical protein
MRNFILSFFLALAFPVLTFATPTFTAVDLGTLPGLNWAPVQPVVQNSGVSAGNSLGGGITYVYQQINGISVGESAIAGSSTCSPSPVTFHAFYSGFPYAEIIHDIGVLNGGCQSAALALNAGSTHIVVGWSQRGVGIHSIDDIGGLKTAFMWDSSSNGILALPSLLHPITEQEIASNESSANSVNIYGEIVGQTAQRLTTGEIAQRAVLWENFPPAPPLELQFQLGKASGTLIFTNAMGINCQGNIAVIGYPVNSSPTNVHSYLLVRNAPQNIC